MTTTPHEPADKPRRASKPKKEIIGLDAPRTIHVRQAEIPGTEQTRIAAIEDAADKYSAKEKLIDGLKDELKNLDAKLREVVHENADKVDRNSDGMLAYNRGDYAILITPGKEKLKVSVGKTDDATSLEVDNEAGEDVD